MRYFDYINKEFIVSPTARRVYRAAAVASFLLFVPVISILLNVPMRPLRPLIFVGVVGTAMNGIAMEYFLFRFDTSHPVKQILWFCVMLIPPIGPALYCFAVYSRSQVIKASLPAVAME